MVAEAGTTVSSLITEVLQLGFGKCKLQVQIPDPTLSSSSGRNGVNGSSSPNLGASVDALTKPIVAEEDLVGKKIATSFDFLAGEYFKKLDAEVTQKRIGEGKLKESDPPLKTTIEYVGGSVEAACALGLADGIVDLVGE